jgi:hypothetical protein
MNPPAHTPNGQPYEVAPTPLTDAFASSVHEGQCLDTCDSYAHDEKCPLANGEFLIADFARDLERKLAEMTDQRDAAITVCGQLRAERDAEREARKALAVAVSHNSKCCCRTDAGSRPCVYCTDRTAAIALAAKLP